MHREILEQEQTHGTLTPTMSDPPNTAAPTARLGLPALPLPHPKTTPLLRPTRLPLPTTHLTSYTALAPRCCHTPLSPFDDKKLLFCHLRIIHRLDLIYGHSIFRQSQLCCLSVTDINTYLNV